MHDIVPYDARSGERTVAPAPSRTQGDTVEGQEEEAGRGVKAGESKRLSAEAARVAAKDGAKRQQAPGSVNGGVARASPKLPREWKVTTLQASLLSLLKLALCTIRGCPLVHKPSLFFKVK